MSSFAAIEAVKHKLPSTWKCVPLKRVACLRERRNVFGSATLLSLRSTGQLVPRGEDVQPPSIDYIPRYWLVEPGHLVVNPMWLAGGAIGVATTRGAVSPDYRVYELSTTNLDPDYAHHLLRSQPYFDQYRLLMRAETTFDRRVTKDDFGELPLLLPPMSVQRQVAEFLDTETARLDALIEKTQRMGTLLEERFSQLVYSGITGWLRSRPGHARRPTRIAWLSDLPSHWGEPSVAANYEVQLGKMLNPDALYGGEIFPYLRNQNVQWDRCDLEDLAEMAFSPEERLRLRLRTGDLLVCEGGYVGRAAVWQEEIEDCLYQKAIHRVRPRTQGNTRFLMYCLRAAAQQGVFVVEGNQSTIVHLTAEKLRAHRFPFPPLDEQQRIVETLDNAKRQAGEAQETLSRRASLLVERRQALITAAVTGGLDIAEAA